MSKYILLIYIIILNNHVDKKLSVQFIRKTRQRPVYWWFEATYKFVFTRSVYKTITSYRFGIKFLFLIWIEEYIFEALMPAG